MKIICIFKGLILYRIQIIGMNDTRILFGIMNNEERIWRYLYREFKPRFAATLIKIFPSVPLHEEIDDIFQEACIILMNKAKEGKVTVSREGGLFSCLVQIGKLIACNMVRKRRSLSQEEIATLTINLHDDSVNIDQKQKDQDDFLDKVFDSIPPDCQMILKYFYWEKKQMDDIASMMGMRNADSAKTKKNKCMNKLKDIAAKLLENDEFAEEAVRAAVERAALRELLNEEKTFAETGVTMAALDIDDESEDQE